MDAVLDIDKKYIDKKDIKRLEIEYGDMEYIILNIVEKVIDVDGSIYKCEIEEGDYNKLKDYMWEYESLDEYNYWPQDNDGFVATMWRVSFYDENETYYHKSGAISYPSKLLELVNLLKSFKKRK